ncbi:P-type conjugative transfer protein VirB9 [bacterium]|nr:P-type conjugative transfer protein VirB9 [bacterium]
MKAWKQLFLLPVLALAVLTPSLALAQRIPVPIPSDRRIRTVVYSPNEVVKFVGHYNYQTSIEFEEGEEIQTISIGDSIAWQLTPVNNRLFLKPVEQAADTNMTLVTNRRSYLFELHARETESMNDPSMVFTLRFVYPDSTLGNVSNYYRQEALPDLQRESYKYNFNYSIAGDARNIEPIRVFDDGRFTYFEFPHSMPELPAIFMVDSANRESIINFRIRGTYMVVERIASRFTLRQGADVICVFNERMPQPKAPEAKKE